MTTPAEKLTVKKRNGVEFQVRTSILKELDVVLSALFNKDAFLYQSGRFQELLRTVPADLLADIHQLPITPNQDNSLLEIAAHMAGVLFEEDYAAASQKIRGLSLQDALECLSETYRPHSLAADQTLTLSEQVADLQFRGLKAAYQKAGFEIQANSSFWQTLQSDCRHAAAILEGGSSHPFFWQWLDRLVERWYAGWRMKNEPLMQTKKKRAQTWLEEVKSTSFSKKTGWLSRVNPLVNNQMLRSAARSGGYSLVLWAEPFNLMDSWSLFPGLMVVSFAEPAIGLKEFEQRVRLLAARTSALGDPTRLTILRLIRHFGLVNTEIAAYLGISRPTVSVHASILREAGLITSRKVGREMHHEMQWEEMKKFLHDLESFLEVPK
jgi:DNA-binding transcriptional ArsR family regulator